MKTLALVAAAAAIFVTGCARELGPPPDLGAPSANLIKEFEDITQLDAYQRRHGF